MELRVGSSPVFVPMMTLVRVVRVVRIRVIRAVRAVRAVRIRVIRAVRAVRAVRIRVGPRSRVWCVGSTCVHCVYLPDHGGGCAGARWLVAEARAASALRAAGVLHCTLAWGPLGGDDVLRPRVVRERNRGWSARAAFVVVRVVSDFVEDVGSLLSLLASRYDDVCAWSKHRLSGERDCVSGCVEMRCDCSCSRSCSRVVKLGDLLLPVVSHRGASAMLHGSLLEDVDKGVLLVDLRCSAWLLVGLQSDRSRTESAWTS